MTYNTLFYNHTVPAITNNKLYRQLINSNIVWYEAIYFLHTISFFSPKLRQKCFLRAIKNQNTYGVAYFLHSAFIVGRYIFSPRIDSEVLCYQLLRFLLSLNLTHLNIFEPFIGTGAQSISIASALKCFNVNVEVYGIDINYKAVIVSKFNAKLNSVKGSFDHISFKNVPNINTTLLIFNPPYLTKREMLGRSDEPYNALYGGIDGLKFYRELINKIYTKRISFEIALIECSVLQVKFILRRLHKLFKIKPVIHELNKFCGNIIYLKRLKL